MSEATPAQLEQQALDAYATRLIPRLLDCSPLDDAERAAIVEGIRQLYLAAGLRWHGNAVFVASPLAGALAAATLCRRFPEKPEARWDFARRVLRAPGPLHRRLRALVRALLRRGSAALEFACHVAAVRVGQALLMALFCVLAATPLGVCAGALWAVITAGRGWVLLGCFAGALSGLTSGPDERSHPGAVLVVTAVGAWIGGAWAAGSTPIAGLASAVEAGFWAAMLIGGTFGALFGAAAAPARSLSSHERRQAHLQHAAGIQRRPVETTRTRIALASRERIARAALRGVGSELVWRLRQSLGGRLALVADDVRAALAQSIAATRDERSLDAAVRSEARRAVARVVRAISGAHSVSTLEVLDLTALEATAHTLLGGQHALADYAWLLWLAQHHERALPESLRALAASYARANLAGGFFAHAQFVLICERPRELWLETALQPVAGQRRLHRTDGPALRYRDGFALYRSHGQIVPAAAVQRAWEVEAIHAHPELAVRRAAAERMGWHKYALAAGWRRVAAEPDPGNPPHLVELYEDPARRLGGFRIVVFVNGSPDGTGHYRKMGEVVPLGSDDPIACVARCYGVSAELYRSLARRT